MSLKTEPDVNLNLKNAETPSTLFSTGYSDKDRANNRHPSRATTLQKSKWQKNTLYIHIHAQKTEKQLM